MEKNGDLLFPIMMDRVVIGLNWTITWNNIPKSDTDNQAVVMCDNQRQE